MSRENVLELCAYAIMIAIAVAVYFFLVRSIRRSQRAAPAASMRTPRQRALHLASGVASAPPFIYYLFFSDPDDHLPLITLWGVGMAIMALLRVAGLPWKFRLATVPLSAALALLAGAAVATWPSLQIASLNAGSWTSLGASAGALALSYGLAILSFPIGFGERKH
jgi:hypothetical protein